MVSLKLPNSCPSCSSGLFWAAHARAAPGHPAGSHQALGTAAARRPAAAGGELTSCVASRTVPLSSLLEAAAQQGQQSAVATPFQPTLALCHGCPSQVATRAEGFAGADLQALCTAAVMAAVRRSSPLLLEQAEREAAAGGSATMAAAAAGPAARQPESGAGAGAAGTAAVGAAAGGGAQALAAEEEQQRRRQEVLDAIEVQACDWREALASAPPPCSRRHGLAALAAEAAAPLQAHELPLLAQPLQQLLAALDAADLPLPPLAAEAAAAAAGVAAGDAPNGSKQRQAGGKQAADLETMLLRHGALLPRAGTAAAADGVSAAAAAVTVAAESPPADVDVERQLQRLGRSFPPCRLLLWGEGEQGQEAAAGALLKLLDGEYKGSCLGMFTLLER